MFGKANDDTTLLNSDISPDAYRASDAVREDMGSIRRAAGIGDDPGEQYAVIGLRDTTTKELRDVHMKAISDVRKMDNPPLPLGKADMKPLSSNIDEVNKAGNVQHTEQFLFENKLNKQYLEECSKKNAPCEILLYTKYSPCISHARPDALGCTNYLQRACNDLFVKYNSKCTIGFDKWWGDSPLWLDNADVKKMLSGSEAAREQLKANGLSDEALGSIDAFFTKGDTQTKVRKNFKDIFETDASGQFKFKRSLNRREFSELDFNELGLVWRRLGDDMDNILLGDNTVIKELKETFDKEFGKALETSEMTLIHKYVDQIDDYFKKNPDFTEESERLFKMNFVRNIDDRSVRNVINIKVLELKQLGKLETIQVEVRDSVTNYITTNRIEKATRSSKAFSDYVEDAFGEAARKTLREDLAIRKTIQELPKENDFIKFFFLDGN